MPYSFEKTYTLQAQAPIIHFQHSQAGATLRATEVKPKLDRFLIEKLRSVPSAWFVREGASALKYKLHFTASNQAPATEPPPIYYGNMNIDDRDKKSLAVFRDCEMTITCFIPALMEQIEKYIAEFFIVSNFGRMQNKGFGSFTIKGASTEPKEIARLLRNHAEAKACYLITGYAKEDFEKIFSDIATVYGVMKSGHNRASYHRSYLFEYCKKSSGGKIGDEKACMKVKKNGEDSSVSPVVVHPKNRSRSFPEQTYDDYQYTRALLGLGDHIGYISDFFDEPTEKNGRMVYEMTGREEISIQHRPERGEEKIARLASPIFFKIINGTIYIVAQRVNPDIFKKTFLFENVGNIKNKKNPYRPESPRKKNYAEITVPECFDIDAFMEYFADRYNKESLQKDNKNRYPSYSIGKRIEKLTEGGLDS